MRGLPFALFFGAAALGLFFSQSYYDSFNIDYLNFASSLDLLFAWLAKVDKLFFVLLFLLSFLLLSYLSYRIWYFGVTFIISILLALWLLLAHLLPAVFGGQASLDRLRWVIQALQLPPIDRDSKPSTFRVRHRDIRAREQEEQVDSSKRRSGLAKSFLDDAKYFCEMLDHGRSKVVEKWMSLVKTKFLDGKRLRAWKLLEVGPQGFLVVAAILLSACLFAVARAVGWYEATVRHRGQELQN